MDRQLTGNYANLTQVETNQRVSVIGTRYFRWRAESYMARYAAKTLYLKNGAEVQTYHLRIEKVGFAKYNIVAYQNRLVETEEMPPCLCEATTLRDHPPPCPRHDLLGLEDA